MTTCGSAYQVNRADHGHGARPSLRVPRTRTSFQRWPLRGLACRRCTPAIDGRGKARWSIRRGEKGGGVMEGKQGTGGGQMAKYKENGGRDVG